MPFNFNGGMTTPPKFQFAAPSSESPFGSSGTTNVFATRSATIPTSSTFMNDIKSLWNDTESSDVTFVVNGQEFPAHKAILAARCTYFRAMFFGDMRESTGHRVEIQDICPRIFGNLLEFMYTDENSQDMTDEDVMAVLMESDKYQLDGLKGLCESFLAQKVSVENAVSFVKFSLDNNGTDKLKERALDVIVSNFHNPAMKPSLDLVEKDNAVMQTIFHHLRVKAVVRNSATHGGFAFQNLDG